MATFKDYYTQQDTDEDNTPQDPDYAPGDNRDDKKNDEMEKLIVKKSQFIREILYRPSKKRFIIRFMDGKIYRYEGVEPMIGDWILNGQHVGHKFNKYIRNNDRIEYERVHE